MSKSRKLFAGVTLLVAAIANAALGGWSFTHPTANQTLSTVLPVMADGGANNNSTTLALVVKSSGNVAEGVGSASTAGYWTVTWSGSANASVGNGGVWPAGIDYIVLYEGTDWRAEQYINF